MKDLKFLLMDTDRHGTERIYFRRYGRKIRIPAALGSAEFVRLYDAALGRLKPRPRLKSGDRFPKGNYVYCIGGDVDSVKIGIACRPELRLRSLQTGCPRRLEIKRLFRAASLADARSFERDLHRCFSQNASVGEWFAVSASRVADRIKVIALATSRDISEVAVKRRKRELKCPT